ncbi:hypothetical protein IPV08_16095 [Methylobacterium sp. SD274]|uniref:hypothetical protein n=1 Tax=Methylobacterium sp. SD274 TaxID=2782009 RepID=UPI001A97BAB9|nr:hypothetical protein [Methylobacterium sp. SD274]MBO1021483.1 hypothetical protein [Methylobacterium sp. SD274]
MTRKLLLAALAFACLAVSILIPMAAFAQVTTTPSVTPAVVIPYGEYVVAVSQLLGDILVPLLVAVIMGLLGKSYPMVRMLVSEALVERTVRKWFDFGVNATAGAMKDNTVTVPVGAEVVANALQRAVNRADVNAVSSWAMDQAGGPEEVAHKLFRMLKLNQGITVDAVVVPALASLSEIRAASHVA